VILAFHSIITAYGFWLPNDPRGSWSDFVGSLELALHRRATKPRTRQSVAAQDHDHQARRQAKQSLRHPAVRFTGLQAQTIAMSLGGTGHPLHACCVMPDHVHLVIGRINRPIRQAAGHLKAEANRALRAARQHPLEAHADKDGVVPTCWAVRSWNVYLDSNQDVIRAMQYVANNPIWAGMKLQKWSFTQLCRGWGPPGLKQLRKPSCFQRSTNGAYRTTNFVLLGSTIHVILN
jgi:REP element-mobilizing transposase RayT